MNFLTIEQKEIILNKLIKMNKTQLIEWIMIDMTKDQAKQFIYDINQLEHDINN